jgi:AraC family transcriptional regulator
MSVLINPPASRLGESNAILWGRGQRRYHVREFPGPLSIKSLVRGAGEWSVGKSRFEVDSGSYLILNQDQPYSLTIDSKSAVETFCIFFSRGFVEDAWRASVTADYVLLDEPIMDNGVGFYQRLHGRDALVSPILRDLRENAMRGDGDLEESFFRLASAMIRLRTGWHREVSRLPAVRMSTRTELYRRVHSGKQMMDELLGQALTLDDIARSSCLSPFHFHRVFKAVFHETPHEYLRRRRLERAARLLRETEEPVTEICLDSGFESPGSFSTLFRARYGASPREFRRLAPK